LELEPVGSLLLDVQKLAWQHSQKHDLHQFAHLVVASVAGKVGRRRGGKAKKINMLSD